MCGGQRCCRRQPSWVGRQQDGPPERIDASGRQIDGSRLWAPSVGRVEPDQISQVRHDHLLTGSSAPHSLMSIMTIRRACHQSRRSCRRCGSPPTVAVGRTLFDGHGGRPSRRSCSRARCVLVPRRTGPASCVRVHLLDEVGPPLEHDVPLDLQCGRELASCQREVVGEHSPPANSFRVRVRGVHRVDRVGQFGV